MPSSGTSSMSCRQRIDAVAAEILAAFKEGTLPKALAQIYIRCPIEVPSRHWSLANRLLGLLRGHAYSAGFRQWRALGRHVRRGERAYHILGPRIVELEEPVEGPEGEEQGAQVAVGFFTIPVFGYAQTEGDPLPGADREAEFIEALPLLEVARSWGLTVEVFDTADDPRRLGFYRPGAAIGLGVKNLSTWAHELTHAADDRLGLNGSSRAECEIVAELGGAVLLECLGFAVDSDRGGAYEYLTRYARTSGRSVLRAATHLLDRTCRCVELLLIEAERLKPEACSKPAKRLA